MSDHHHPLQDFLTGQGPDAALNAVVAGVPRDQALGLRLIALARAAAAAHMTGRVTNGRSEAEPSRSSRGEVTP